MQKKRNKFEMFKFIENNLKQNYLYVKKIRTRSKIRSR